MSETEWAGQNRSCLQTCGDEENMETGRERGGEGRRKRGGERGAEERRREGERGGREGRREGGERGEGEREGGSIRLSKITDSIPTVQVTGFPFLSTVGGMTDCHSPPLS